jgi:hypothetical protein
MQGISTLHTDSNESVSGVERLKCRAAQRIERQNIAEQINALTALATVLFRGCFNSLNAMQRIAKQITAPQSIAPQCSFINTTGE